VGFNLLHLNKKNERKITFGENVEGYSVPVLNEREIRHLQEYFS